MTLKKHQNLKGGLNAAGRKHFGVKAPIKTGTNPRRVSFAARMAGNDGPLKNKKGEPTRLALSFKAWGFRNRQSARNFANKHKKS